MPEAILVPARLNRYFLISTYLTITLAIVCLVSAEWGLMPEIRYLAALVFLLMAIAYVLEGRWVLSIFWANVVGMFIAAVLGAWLLLQSTRSANAGLLRQIPWPTSLLPYLGPLLMLCLPAKMLRPKTPDDYWWAQLIGVACVGLACVLTDDPAFGLLLLAYLLSGLWCLALFLLYRESLGQRELCVQRLPGWGQVASWAAPILVLAVAVFMYTPRSGNNWQFDTGRIQDVGMSEDTAIDLNKVATLEMNRDLAFEVFAQNADGTPKLDLPTDQRWRGAAFRTYSKDGRWSNNAPAGSRAFRDLSDLDLQIRGTVELPDLGPNKYYLTVQFKDDKLGRRPFLADPVQFDASRRPPVIQLLRNGKTGTFSVNSDGEVVPDAQFHHHYKQVTRPPAEPDLGPEYNSEQILTFREPLPSNSLPREWTEQLLQRLAGEGKLPNEALTDRRDGEFQPQHYERIGRALEHYLSTSGEYRYSLTLTRSDLDLDPIVDFLYYTKTGHCNRFASALTIMLRSVQIPARVVTGFRGAEPRGDGWYDVRHCHAHSWVEVYVERFDPLTPQQQGMGGATSRWRSLTLDPTPLAESVEAAVDAGAWWNSSAWDLEQLYKDLFLNYSPERRDAVIQRFREAGEAIWAAFRRNLTAHTSDGVRLRTALGVTGAGLTLALVALGRRLQARRRRRRAALPPVIAYHQRLLTILARRGWKPAPAQTAREFIAAVAPHLSGEQADVARRTVALYYRDRFGRQVPQSDELRQIEAGLDRLAAALTAN